MASVPTQVRRLEVSAYQSIMKALAVTGLTWEREDLIAKLRIELNVSNEDHMKVRENVGGDENVKRLRDAFVQYKLTPPEPPAAKRQKTQKKQQQYYQQQYPGDEDDDEDGYAPPQQQYRQARPPKEPKPPSARMQKQLEKAAVLAKKFGRVGSERVYLPKSETVLAGGRRVVRLYRDGLQRRNERTLLDVRY